MYLSSALSPSQQQHQRSCGQAFAVLYNYFKGPRTLFEPQARLVWPVSKRGRCRSACTVVLPMLQVGQHQQTSRLISITSPAAVLEAPSRTSMLRACQILSDKRGSTAYRHAAAGAAGMPQLASSSTSHLAAPPAALSRVPQAPQGFPGRSRSLRPLREPPCRSQLLGTQGGPPVRALSVGALGGPQCYCHSRQACQQKAHASSHLHASGC